VPTVTPMGNHIYAFGSKDYRTTPTCCPTTSRGQPGAGRAGLGPPGGRWVRAKDGKQLSLRLVIPAGNPISDAISKVALNQLAQIGVRIVVDAVRLTSSSPVS